MGAGCALWPRSVPGWAPSAPGRSPPSPPYAETQPRDANSKPAAARQKIDDAVDDALSKGKITAARRKHWVDLITADPAMADVIASVPNETALPLTAIGHGISSDGQPGDAGRGLVLLMTVRTLNVRRHPRYRPQPGRRHDQTGTDHRHRHP